MVKCPRCGYENNRNSTYCVNCTYRLIDSKKDSLNKSRIKSTSSRNITTGKKIAIAIVIIIVAFILFSLIYTMTTPGPEDSHTIVTTNETGTQISSTPYVVAISYNGSWAASMGQANNLFNTSGQGNFEKRLDCVVWDHIVVDVKMTDSGNGPLRVVVYKEGEAIFDESTTDSSKTIHFEINN